MCRKTLFKAESLGGHLESYLQSIVSEICEHTKLILRGTESFNAREFEFDSSHVLKEVVESNDRVLKAIGDVEKFNTKEDKLAENLLKVTSEVIQKALDQNQHAANLCSDYEKVSGGESPISLKLNRYRSTNNDLSMMVQEAKQADVSQLI